MSTQSLDSDIYDYGFILNSTALHEAAMSVLVTTIYGRWRGTTTVRSSFCNTQLLFLQQTLKKKPKLFLCDLSRITQVFKGQPIAAL